MAPDSLPFEPYWAQSSRGLLQLLVQEPRQPRAREGDALEGHGLGKLFAGLALSQARKGADEFAASIKRAVEAET